MSLAFRQIWARAHRLLRFSALPKNEQATLLAAVIALGSLIAIAAMVMHGRIGVGRAGRDAGPAAAVAGMAAPLPAKAPVSYFALSPEEARRINAAIPFAAIPNPPARAWRFAGNAEDRERAVTCLASAAYYEAGDDDIGGRAVVQVVLNRLRHPAFPKSICGVVFEGAERRAGCQFTFTCDGALDRRPQPDAWARARAIAEKALDGAVYSPVGVATHYHTDWVVPNWSPEMDKVARVHTHLFFRWRGIWGQPAAFRRAYSGPEVLDQRIAGLSKLSAAAAIDQAATTDGLPLLALKPSIAGVSDSDLQGNVVQLVDEGRGEYLLALDPAAYPGSYAVVAWKICQNRSPCRVLGWLNRQHMPTTLPLKGAWRSTVSFSFEKGATGDPVAYWNCREIKRDDPAQCLPGGYDGLTVSDKASNDG